MKKRITALILAMTMIFAVMQVSANAAATASQETAVANMYLCSNWSGLPSLGHIWVYIENISDKTLTVGAYELPPKQGVSIGTFALTRSDGAGVYYNIEAYCGNKFGMSSFISMKTELNESELNTVSNKILSSNFWDPIIINCAFFAISTWDMGGGAFVFPIVVLPVLARIQLKMHSYSSDLKMYYPDREQVYKQHGAGSGATLSVVSDGSVDTVPG